MKIKGNHINKLSKKLVRVMKKCTVRKDLSRTFKNTAYSGLNRNIVEPEMSATCYPGEESRRTGLEIAEIKSSSSEQSIEDHPELAHPWSYINTSRFKDCDIGYEQRSRVDRETTHNPERRYDRKTAYNNLSAEAKSIYNDIISSEYNECYNGVTIERGPTFFADPRKPRADSESSDNDNYEETLIDCIEEAQKCNGYKYKDDSGDGQSEDAWLYYSCGLYGFDVETNRAMQINEVTEKNTQTSRVATPMPKPFVPKLDLAHVHAFHTLTEVTEPKNEATSQVSSSIDTQISPKLNKVTGNNLLHISWLGLSPRNKIRLGLKKYKRGNDQLNHNVNEAPLSSIRKNKPKQLAHKEEYAEHNESLCSNITDIEVLDSDQLVSQPINHDICSVETIVPSNQDRKEMNPFVSEDLDEITQEQPVNQDEISILNPTNLELHTAIYAEVNDANNVTYVVYKYRKSLTDEQCNTYKNAGEVILLMHDKSTQVSIAQLTRHIGLFDIVRLLRKNNHKQDFAERRSWIRRFAKCFCCCK